MTGGGAGVDADDRGRRGAGVPGLLRVPGDGGLPAAVPASMLMIAADVVPVCLVSFAMPETAE